MRQLSETTDPFLNVPSEIMSAWLDACRAQFHARRDQSRSAWKVAAQAWDTLVKMHSPVENDQLIYQKLAIEAWTTAADTRRKA